MIKKAILYIISTCILSNIEYSNASNLKHKVNEQININTNNNQQYWDEFLPTLKCDAKLTLIERFDYCTDKLINFLTNDFYKKAIKLDNYKYFDCNQQIDDIIDIEKLKNEIKLRKQLLHCLCYKHELKGNAWSQLPLTVFSYNDDHRNKLCKTLFWDNALLHNHWDMKFDKGFNNIKLNFYPSYEYQDPYFYSKYIDAEEILSTCLSAIEMDLATSNNITSNIELFANRLISKKNNCAIEAINRYEKYLTKEQNAMLAKHIISYYFSSFDNKNNNIAKHLINKYLLNDLFKNMKPNQFLTAIKHYKTDDWFDAVIKQYLADTFGTSYNKEYLKSLQRVILTNMKDIKTIALPIFRKYISVIFENLTYINQKIINKDDKYLATRKDKKNLIIPLTKEQERIGKNITRALYGASANTGIRSIDNIISYLSLSKENKSSNKKCKK